MDSSTIWIGGDTMDHVTNAKRLTVFEFLRAMQSHSSHVYRALRHLAIAAKNAAKRQGGMCWVGVQMIFRFVTRRETSKPAPKLFFISSKKPKTKFPKPVLSVSVLPTVALNKVVQMLI